MEFVNTKIVLDCAAFEAIEIKHIMADGKIGVDDFAHIIDMAKNYEKIVNLVKAIPGMKLEFAEALKVASSDPIVVAELLLIVAGEAKEVIQA